MNVDTSNDTIELTEDQKKALYITTFAIGVVAGASAAHTALFIVRPKVVAFKNRRAIKKALKTEK